MDIRTDILLRGSIWNETIEKLKDIFSDTPNYSIFMLALSVGIMYDKREIIEKNDNDDAISHKSVPRNVINNNDHGKLDVYFQAAIISTETETFTEDDRLEFAFGDETEFNKVGFLVEFANFGINKLYELIGATAIETMENIKNFCAVSIEGRNLEIDTLTDEILLQGAGSDLY